MGLIKALRDKGTDNRCWITGYEGATVPTKDVVGVERHVSASLFGRPVPEPPDRPRSMPVDKYKAEYDSTPCVVVHKDGSTMRFGGAVRAWLYARGQQGARVVR